MAYITKGIGGFYYVKTPDGIVECKARGIFRKRGITPVAGDNVTLSDDGTMIDEILPRKNVFIRPPIANLDILFIVTSTTQPVPSTLVLDQLAAAAIYKDVQPVLVVTKSDLAAADMLRTAYAGSGIPLVQLNYETGEGLDEVKGYIEGHLCAFCGNSGVGKSTLLSVVSKARPKIANYHFTTLFPNLGVVYVDEGVSFVMADIPGIIEGAADGAGLGHDFLRHIDRCRLLVHVVDVSGSEGRDPVEDFDAINAELKQYSPDLAERPQIVAANKVDILPPDSDNLERLRSHVEALGYTLLEISAAAHQGTRELVKKTAEMLSVLPPVTVYEPEYVPKAPVIDASAPLDIHREDDGTWIVEGPWLRQVMGNVNFADYESRMWFDKVLRDNGFFQKLEEMGIQDGDIVSLYDFEFEYQR